MKGNAMSLPTIQIEVGQETARLLLAKASARQLSLDEILAPFRAEVEAKGYSEDELDELFTEARKEVFQAKQQNMQK